MSLPTRRIWLAFVLVLALALRLWRINLLPPGFHFDEAFEGLEAWRILHDPAYRPLFLTGNFGVLPLNAYANALAFAIAESLGGAGGPTTMRVTAAVFGTLGVLAVYGVADELRLADAPRSGLSPAFPLWSAAVLALMRWHLHFSRMGIEPILTPLIWAGSTWLLLRTWRTGSWWSAIGGGMLLAAAMYAYQGAWIIPLLAVVTAVLLILRPATTETGNLASVEGDRRWRPASSFPLSTMLLKSTRISQLLLAALVALLCVAPLAWYFWQQPDQFLLRPAQIAVVGEGGASASASPGQMAWATAKMFGPFGAPGDQDPRRNLPGAPALNLWLAIPFYLGLALVLLHWRRLASLILLTSLVGLLLPGVLSEYAPHFHRVLGAAAPVALLCGLGLDWLWGVGKAGAVALRWPAAMLRLATVLLLVLGGVVSLRDYFVRWAALPDLFYAFDVGLWEVGQQIATMPSETQLYLTPRDAGHPTLAFALQTGAAAAPRVISFDGRHIFPLTAAKTDRPETYAAIEHEDFRTRLLLPEIFPSAVVTREISDAQGAIYARFYTRPAQTTPQRPPQQPFAAEIGDGIRLLGYDLQPATLHPGEMLYLQLHWLVDQQPAGDWTVFTHVTSTNAGGTPTVVAGHDSRPGEGSLPTVRWQAGWRVLDEYQIPLPAELAPGVYTLEIGLYQASGEQLPAGQPSLVLGEVTIE
jgi:hypothetical protein